MRVLFITAYYPPCDFGWGYMQLCARVADELHARGHAVAVLTSTYRHGPEQAPYPVHRDLPLDPDWHSEVSAMRQFFFSRSARAADAERCLENLVAAFDPEVLFVWHAQGLPRRMLRRAEELPGRTVVYYLANYYPETQDEYLEYWRHPGRSALPRLLKTVLRPAALAKMRFEGYPLRLDFRNTIHVSRYVKDRLSGKGRIGPRAVVIPNGVDLAALGRLHREPAGEPLRLMVAGRISPEKGVHTVVSALAALPADARSRLTLTIMGDGPEDYVRQIHAQVAGKGLEGVVRCQPPADLETYRRTLATHDVLVFASVWDEPLSTIMLEAMALGLLVIGTDLGGSKEILSHGETGLVFSAEDPADLADQIRYALEHPAEREALAGRGEQLAREAYPLRATFDRIEQHLNLLRPGGGG